MSIAQTFCVQCRPPGVEKLRAEHIDAESSVVSAGAMYIVFGVCLIAAVIMISGIGLFMHRHMVLTIKNAQIEPDATWALVALASAALCAFTGWGLRRFARWSRYQALSVVVPGACLSLWWHWWPAGLVFGYHVLLLFGRNSAVLWSESYRAAIKATPHLNRGTLNGEVAILTLLVLAPLLFAIAISVLR